MRFSFVTFVSLRHGLASQRKPLWLKSENQIAPFALFVDALGAGYNSFDAKIQSVHFGVYVGADCLRARFDSGSADAHAHPAHADAGSASLIRSSASWVEHDIH